MTEAMLLQVCPNDLPPFADICRFYEAAARSLGWRPVTVMLEGRSPRPEGAFHYLDTGSAAEQLERLGAPVLTLCHRYRAWRWVARRGYAAPVVVAHEFGLLDRRRRRLQRRWDALLGRPRARFAGVSEAVTEELAGWTGDALLLPNGLDLARADAERVDRAAARTRLALPDEAFAVGVVGRLHPKKRPELALAGFCRAAPDMPKAQLVLVGGGELEGDLKRQLEAEGGGAAVTLAGFLPDAPRLMAAFDLLLLPSGEREAFGMVALEAMAAGVPVMCGPSPGPRFVAGGTGLGFEADDAAGLARALLDAYRRWQTGELARLTRAARQRVEAEFSVPAAAGRLARLADQ